MRDFATDKHRSVDDTCFGGGAGMVLRPNVVDAALEQAVSCEVPGTSRPLIYLDTPWKTINAKYGTAICFMFWGYPLEWAI